MCEERIKGLEEEIESLKEQIEWREKQTENIRSSLEFAKQQVSVPRNRRRTRTSITSITVQRLEGQETSSLRQLKGLEDKKVARERELEELKSQG